jgi:predicted nuclease of predicted toxin-antitoxin system
MYPWSAHPRIRYSRLFGERCYAAADSGRLSVSGRGRHNSGARLCRSASGSSGYSIRVTVRFLIDAQLPPALIRVLNASGQEAVHVGDIGLLQAPDRDIWQRAAAMHAVLVTKDEDFIVMRALDAGGPAVVWVRLGNAKKRALLSRFVAVLPRILAALERGETVIEISDL